MPFISSVRGTFGPQSENRGVGSGNAIPELLRQNPNSPSLPTGGTITVAGGYRIHTFLNTDTFSTVALGAPVTVEYMVIGGGGAGGGRHGGGGGAGGLVLSTNALLPANSYTMTVGDGHGTAPQSNGASSERAGDSTISSPSITTVTAFGGGRGATHSGNRPNSGGSGGGSESVGYTANGSAIQSNQPLNGIGYGHPGGGGGNSGDRQTCGNGGGSAQSGQSAGGGSGIQSSITGTNYYWAAGGGGAWHNGNGPGSFGRGGTGGGGGGGGIGPSSPTNGGTGGLNAGAPGDWRTNGAGGAGGANTGSGGGGGAEAPQHGNNHPGGSAEGGAGGKGIIVARYSIA